MTIKELKDYLNNFNDNLEIDNFYKTATGLTIEFRKWEK